MLAALIYFFYRLVATVGRVLAEIILWLLYYLFWDLVRRIAEALQREYWWRLGSEWCTDQRVVGSSR